MDADSPCCRSDARDSGRRHGVARAPYTPGQVSVACSVRAGSDRDAVSAEESASRVKDPGEHGSTSRKMRPDREEALMDDWHEGVVAPGCSPGDAGFDRSPSSGWVIRWWCAMARHRRRRAPCWVAMDARSSSKRMASCSSSTSVGTNIERSRAQAARPPDDCRFACWWRRLTPSAARSCSRMSSAGPRTERARSRRVRRRGRGSGSTGVTSAAAAPGRGGSRGAQVLVWTFASVPTPGATRLLR